MTVLPPNVTGAEWFSDPTVRRVFAVLRADGEGARVVGGAVRNTLMDRPVSDIDFGTSLTPDQVTKLAGETGIRAVPTGIEHGTVTLVVDGNSFQVTTLRDDIATDGRHAVVRFGSDWVADARRRDFTMNALSVDASGRVFDPLGGLDDIRSGTVRFIGDPDARIAEDRLRILRLFRFHAEYGRDQIRTNDLAAAVRGRHGLSDLAAERIGAEVSRIIMARRAAEVAVLMQDYGILPLVLGGIGYLEALRRVVAFEGAARALPSVSLRLAAVAARVEEDVERVTQKLRLTNAQFRRMNAAIVLARRLNVRPDDRQARRLVYLHGQEAFRDGVVLASAWVDGESGVARWLELYDLPVRRPTPVFPISGRDVTALGVTEGPRVGRLLALLEAFWIDHDFKLSEAELRTRLQAMIAAAQ